MLSSLGVTQVRNESLTRRLLPYYPLAYPLLCLLANHARPLGPFKTLPEGQAAGLDWVVHAHFGDFTNGILDLPICRSRGACPPGSITAVMDSLVPHAFPPVNGERLIISQATIQALARRLRAPKLDLREHGPTISTIENARWEHMTLYCYWLPPEQAVNHTYFSDD